MEKQSKSPYSVMGAGDRGRLNRRARTLYTPTHISLDNLIITYDILGWSVVVVDGNPKMHLVDRQTHGNHICHGFKVKQRHRMLI